MLTIRHETDDWRECLLSAIDDAEQMHGSTGNDVTAYDDAAGVLRSGTIRRLDDAGVEYKWANQQSVGLAVLLQGGGTYAEREAFYSAMAAARPEALKMVDRIAARV